MDELTSVLAGIASGSVKAFYIHLAEGRSDNPRSTAELDTLAGLGALTPQTIVIHGTALSADQLGQVHDAGAKLVWSPESNLRLYGETTLAASAVELGIPVGLGADWLPSGSTSLLAEMKVARRCLALQSGADPGARRLVDMVTRDAAVIAGLDDRLGALEAGRPADVTVFERVHADPWESVVRSDPAQVDLVLIGGDVAYGRPAFVQALVGEDRVGRYGQEIAWGEPMLLDTGFQAHPGAPVIPTLSQLRAALIGAYPHVGPIYA
jgi:5-methylthioadenosine/S-adenosylhomocysteine deaminase